MNLQHAWIAAERFGYGARPDELAGIAKDPKGWLRAQVDTAAAVPPNLKRLPPSATQITRVMEARRLGDERLMQRTRKNMGQASRREAILRTLSAVESDLPFRERLVHFWSNHFTVSAKRSLVSPIVGAFEREAIRPHVSGQFMDMLLASTRHPAMLLYLDNASSVGPNSIVGRRRGRGLNENLAREILELHTLGVDGGYRQEDVVALAELLTGWSIARPEDAQAGKFHFRAYAHQPGSKTLLGQRFDQGGVAEGEWALALLSRHPATARHVAAKLTRHFVSDSRVEDWRASLRVRWLFRRFRSGPQSGSHGHVSSPRSSNRTCGFPASGFRTRSCLRARKAQCVPRQTGEAVFFV